MSDEITDHRTWTHSLSEDGLTLTIEEVRPSGVYWTTVGWTTRAEAEANIDTALKMYAERGLGDQLLQVGQKQHSRRVGPFYLTVLAGPPTWWLPRFGFRRERRHIMVGWLRRGYVIALRGRRCGT